MAFYTDSRDADCAGIMSAQHALYPLNHHLSPSEFLFTCEQESLSLVCSQGSHLGDAFIRMRIEIQKVGNTRTMTDK